MTDMADRLIRLAGSRTKATKVMSAFNELRSFLHFY